MTPSDLRIREFTDDLAADFEAINSAWITAMYSLEAPDIEILSQPRAKIIEPGGDILFVEAEGLGVVGACALMKTGEGEFELTKMGVLESARGRKAGEFLLKAIIARAEALGATTLYLLSNRKSAAAIHLYEKLGFVHDEETMRRHGAHYERCNVAMRYVTASAPLAGAAGAT
jgi:N-acetylglutamate synthase-like GNAT family acetyltransferase